MTGTVGMPLNDGTPKKGWVRIQMEPIDIPIDGDETLLFSVIQSSIPGAHSLYYKENGVQKALKYDSCNGKIYKPSQGWESTPIFVNIAHGCRPYGKKADSYVAATERFEKTVELVQKMISASGGYGKKGKGLDSLTVGAMLREKGLLKKSHSKEDIIDKEMMIKEEIKKELPKIENEEIKKLENEMNELKKNNSNLEKELKECKEWMIEFKNSFSQLKTDKEEVKDKKEVTEKIEEKVINYEQENKALQFENDTLRQELIMAEQKIEELNDEISKKDFAMNTNRYNSSKIHPNNLYDNQEDNKKEQEQPQQQQQQNYQQPQQQHNLPNPYGIPFQYSCCMNPPYPYINPHHYINNPRVFDNQLYKPPYEEELNLKRKQLELADNKIKSLEVELDFEKKRTEKNDSNLKHGFLIKKQPCGLRNKADILTTDCLSKNGYELKRTWFEIELPWKANDVYLVGSFTNWECALKCNSLRNSNNKYGIWCDVPQGTHEFKFIADGAWVHSNYYQACSNDFKTLNNFISVN
uniref:AMPK1_CBM domain-containing protein n=1 Tax=Parastrongyloides trichosuri TaxID=131310 RepID=A0A0N4Z7C3_PARTI